MTVDTDLAGRLIGVLRSTTGMPDLEYERCHGDLHPFNLLADGDRVTVVDWSAALLAPQAYDVAFTSLLLSEPPLRVQGWQRPLVRVSGWVHHGVDGTRAGHPWLMSGPAFARRIASLTGAPVRAR